MLINITRVYQRLNVSRAQTDILILLLGVKLEYHQFMIVTIMLQLSLGF